MVIFKNKKINKKNICIVTEEFRPSLKGGIATWSREIADYFHSKSYNVTVYLKKHGGIKKSFNVNNLPYKIHLISGRDWAFFKKWYVFFSIFKYLKNKNKPIIISTNWELSQGIVFYKNIFQFSLVTILHGLEVTRLNSLKYNNRITSFKKTLMRSDKIISVSHYTKKVAESLNKYDIKIDVVPNFVNFKNFHPIDKKLFINDFTYRENDRILLTLSRLVKRKGHYTVIKALKPIISKNPNVFYLIAGTGDKSYEKELKHYVRKLNLEKNINFLGYISEAKKKIIYNLCDLYVMTSIPTDERGDSEGFGITFLEANACGKPVIGTNVGGISDAINDGFNGYLIKPNDPLELEKKITSIIYNNKLYKSLSENSINHIKKNFDIQLIGKRFDMIIDELYDTL